ncbi:hypothetical protein ABZ567_08900 [Streptomyces sp. NPDC016459]|uniref:hypothetical protein n=1 Tax=Streptomyces sp. NPDC016459 TaxID=3157190 RepID=UPI0033D64FC7
MAYTCAARVCYVMKAAATSTARLERIVDELAEFGSTTIDLALSRTLPLRGPRAHGSLQAPTRRDHLGPRVGPPSEHGNLAHGRR